VLLGRIRDLDAECCSADHHRKRRPQTARQLSTDNRTLAERLTPARSNLRFHDRRIADLEARLTEPANPT
jgi:hypothetical protein